MVTLKEATSKDDIKKFVTFPFSLYKNSPPLGYPPLISDETDTFDRDKNPAYKTARIWLFLAYQNDKPVGRIAAVINDLEIEEQQTRKMRFGWCDFIDDAEVSKALLDKVLELAKKEHMNYVEGPLGFSNLDKVGVLTEGFDSLGTMVTWYNHPYYREHYERLGFKVEKEYVENIMDTRTGRPPHFFTASINLSKAVRAARNQCQEQKRTLELCRPHVRPVGYLLLPIGVVHTHFQCPTAVYQGQVHRFCQSRTDQVRG